MALVKPFRIKEIDMAYCMRCRWRMFAPRALYDFCLYDGMACSQNCEDDFNFTCKHFDPIPYHILDKMFLSLTTKHF